MGPARRLRSVGALGPLDFSGPAPSDRVKSSQQMAIKPTGGATATLYSAAPPRPPARTRPFAVEAVFQPLSLILLIRPRSGPQDSYSFAI